MTEAKTASRWIKCISKNGSIRGVAVQATEVAQEIVSRHGLDELGAKGLGEAIVGALFSAAYCDDGGRINLNVQTEGSYKQVFVDAHSDGRVRGYLMQRSEEEFSPRSSRGPWGEGVISILRTKDEKDPAPYIGTVPLVTGHLAKDLTFYWAQSEQTPSAIGLAVRVEKGAIVAAGGFMVQVMPGATASEVAAIENEVDQLGEMAEEFSKNSNPVKLLSRVFSDMTFLVLEERPIEFRCTCSQERVESALALIEIVEIQRMIDQNEPGEVRCDFCSTEYFVQTQAMQKILHQKIEAATRKLRKEMQKSPQVTDLAAAKRRLAAKKKKSKKKKT